jgi:hypothetical protein
MANLWKIGKKPNSSGNIATNSSPGLVWKEFLGAKKWTYFCTFTTGYELTQKSARRLMERYFQRICDYIRVGEKPCSEISMFWATEPFELKDGCHIHALLYLPKEYTSELHFQNLIHIYQIASGNKISVMDKKTGACRFESWNRVDFSKYKGKTGASYCSKYVTKRMGDYDYYSVSI